MKMPIVCLLTVIFLSGCQTMDLMPTGESRSDKAQSALATINNCYAEFFAMPEYATYRKYVTTGVNDPQRIQKITNTTPVPVELIESVLKVFPKDDQCTNLQLDFYAKNAPPLVEVIIEFHSDKTATAANLVAGKYATVGEFATARYENHVAGDRAWRAVMREKRSTDAANAAARRKEISESMNAYQDRQNRIFESLLNRPRISCTSSVIGSFINTNCF